MVLVGGLFVIYVLLGKGRGGVWNVRSKSSGSGSELRPGLGLGRGCGWIGDVAKCEKVSKVLWFDEVLWQTCSWMDC